MKMAVFWDVAQCSLIDTDVSELLNDNIALMTKVEK
jgi:hypothetical protein